MAWWRTVSSSSRRGGARKAQLWQMLIIGELPRRCEKKLNFNTLHMMHQPVVAHEHSACADRPGELNAKESIWAGIMQGGPCWGIAKLHCIGDSGIAQIRMVEPGKGNSRWVPDIADSLALRLNDTR